MDARAKKVKVGLQNLRAIKKVAFRFARNVFVWNHLLWGAWNNARGRIFPSPLGTSGRSEKTPWWGGSQLSLVKAGIWKAGSSIKSEVSRLKCPNIGIFLCKYIKPIAISKSKTNGPS